MNPHSRTPLAGRVLPMLMVALGGLLLADRPARGDDLNFERTVAKDSLATAPVRRQGIDPNPRPVVGEKMVRLAYRDDNVVRSGPGERFSLVGVHPRGSEFPVIAKSGDWYNVRLSETRTAWIHASLCQEFDDLSILEFRPNPRLYSRVGSFVVTGTLGGYSFDRKSNSLSVGGRLGYYLLDFAQVEGGLAWTQVVRPAEIVESLFDLSLEEEAFHMLFYDLNITAELLPGRQMVPFVTGGVGATILKGKAEPGYNLGGGVQVYFGKTHAVRWEVRNHRFKSGSGAARRTNSNFEFTVGTLFLL